MKPISNFSKYYEYLFTALYTLSVLGKLLFPNTLRSWLQSFYMETGIYRSGLNLVDVSYFALLVIEVILIVYISSRKKIFYLFNCALLLVFFVGSLYAHLINMPGDCGCFGKIIIFENGWDKALFNGVLFGLSIVLYYLAQKEKTISEKLLQTQDV